MSSPTGRRYTDGELKAFRYVTRHEWRGSGDPAERGPAQYATQAQR